MKNDSVCPLCGRKNYTTYLQISGRRIVHCCNDGLLFVNPQPDAREINRMYNGNYFSSDKKRAETSVGYYDYMAEKPLLLPYFRRKVMLLAAMLSGNKVLEVGSSYGFFLEEAQRVHLDILGIDISRAAVTYANGHGLPSRTVDLFQAKFPPHSFDGVAAFHLIEHVVN
jgi:2-polyprenyl-3-methyl-5-hydroxy-6-metoxy-1,4-benzoquinol methylase